MYNTKIAYLLVTKVPISGHIKTMHAAKLFFDTSGIFVLRDTNVTVRCTKKSNSLDVSIEGGIIQVRVGQVRPPQN